MAFCRFLDADAYIYDDVHYGLICCACSMGVDGNFIAGYNYDLMLQHIAEHREQRDFIPLDVDERLRLERDCIHDIEDTDHGPRCTICWRAIDE